MVLISSNHTYYSCKKASTYARIHTIAFQLRFHMSLPMFLIYLLACRCGSIINGHRLIRCQNKARRSEATGVLAEMRQQCVGVVS